MLVRAAADALEVLDAQRRLRPGLLARLRRGDLRQEDLGRVVAAVGGRVRLARRRRRLFERGKPESSPPQRPLVELVGGVHVLLDEVERRLAGGVLHDRWRQQRRGGAALRRALPFDPAARRRPLRRGGREDLCYAGPRVLVLQPQQMHQLGPFGSRSNHTLARALRILEEVPQRLGRREDVVRAPVPHDAQPGLARQEQAPFIRTRPPTKTLILEWQLHELGRRLDRQPHGPALVALRQVVEVLARVFVRRGRLGLVGRGRRLVLDRRAF
mmetsp:Transcript_16670/g.43708  ORF Transcript_16670/g.43708 Transcript_16670/m.43708 type:complete len:271 (-) Transcript_16670:1333-2145(-)